MIGSGQSAGDDGPAVLVDDRGAVRVITLNRPRVRNAINTPLAEGLRDALDDAGASHQLRVAIVQGAGGSFCSGMDLRAFADAPAALPARALELAVRRTTHVPVIAAIEGFAVGGGCELALACDLLVAARGSVMGLPEVRRSLVPSGGGLVRLPRRLPLGIALEMGLTGHPLPAERLYELGLVNALCEPGETEACAVAMAMEIAGNGPLAVAASRDLLWAQADWDEPEAWRAQDAVSAELNASADAAEGIAAFLEKRAPSWAPRG